MPGHCICGGCTSLASSCVHIAFEGERLCPVGRVAAAYRERTKPVALDQRPQSHSTHLWAVEQCRALSHSHWPTRYGAVRAAVRPKWDGNGRVGTGLMTPCFEREGEPSEPIWQLLMGRERRPVPLVSIQASCIDSNARALHLAAALARQQLRSHRIPKARCSALLVAAAAYREHTTPVVLDQRPQSHSTHLWAVEQCRALSHGH